MRLQPWDRASHLATTMVEQKYFTLNTGARIPAVGMGCWMGAPGAFDLADGMVMALKTGYRHFDTASMYGNEDVVGEKIRESGIPREEIFVTTKLPNQDHANVERSFDKSLEQLGLEYIDLYLMHWPQGSAHFVDTWKSMEKLLETRKGKVRAIGVSNFSVKTLNELLPQGKVVPAVNQIETHPFLPDWDVVELCKKHNILVTAYTPLGQANSPILKDPDVMAVAEETHASPGQVALSWNVQRGVGVLPKSTNPTRALQNLQLISLTDKQMERISNISKDPKRYGRLNYVAYNSATDTVMGASIDELGWEDTRFYKAD